MDFTSHALGEITLRMEDPLVLRNAPLGTRIVVPFVDVQWQGERVQARQKGTSAGDWLVVTGQGVALLDMRFCLETSDGALLYISGPGKTDAAGFASGAPVYFFPQVETNDKRYDWLQRLTLVAKGAATGKQVRFSVYEIQ